MKLKKYSSLALILVTCNLLLVTAVRAATTSSDSGAIDPETIKENIKRRIEQVVKNQAAETRKRMAFIGVFSSVTKNSFSLQANDGTVKQASTSASTVVVNVYTNKEMSFNDISIGDYVAVLGFLNDDNPVLDARRILMLETKPEIPTKVSLYGLTGKKDLKKNTITIKDLKTGQDIIFKLSSKILIQMTQDASRKTKITATEIPENNQVLVIFEPGKKEKDDKIISSMLIRGAPPIPTPSSKP